MNIRRYIPNTLTITRVLLCPAIVIAAITNHSLLALVLFLVAAISDYLDGFLARKWSVVSSFGASFDPIADKFVALVFFLLFHNLGMCPPWFLGLFISVLLLQSFGLLALRISMQDRKFSIRPIRLGKWNMALQFIWIGIVLTDIYIRHQFPDNFHYSTMFYGIGYSIVGISQVTVFFRYFFYFRRFILSDLRPQTS